MSENWNHQIRQHRTGQRSAIALAALRLLLSGGTSALTMASLAKEAGISRPTLYRYFDDVDSVLVAVAEEITAHEDEFLNQISKHTSPKEQLHEALSLVLQAEEHDTERLSQIRLSLPPVAREVLANHEMTIQRAVSVILQAGVDSGDFRVDLQPETDALFLLAIATSGGDPQRARALIHRLVDH